MKTSITRRNLLAGGAAAGICAFAPKRGIGAAAEERRLRIDPEASIGTIRPELHATSPSTWGRASTEGCGSARTRRSRT